MIKAGCGVNALSGYIAISLPMLRLTPDAYLPYSSRNHWRHGAHATARSAARWCVNTPTLHRRTFAHFFRPALHVLITARIQNSAASYTPPNTTLPNHGQIAISAMVNSSPVTNLSCAVAYPARRAGVIGFMVKRLMAYLLSTGVEAAHETDLRFCLCEKSR